jgi:hypothetical protein
MLALWRSLPARHPVLEARLHARTLSVEELENPHHWRWTIRSAAGSKVAEGDAASATEAEDEAEREFYAVHPPGDWGQADRSS